MTQTDVQTSQTEYEYQSEKLSLETGQDPEGSAVKATFITPLDPVLETANGKRLPAVPVQEAHKLNILRDTTEGEKKHTRRHERILGRKARIAQRKSREGSGDDSLSQSLPPLRTHPLFPPLPLYGPPSALRKTQYLTFRVISFILSTLFLLAIVLGAVVTSTPRVCRRIWYRVTLRDPDRARPFFEEERRRATHRREEERKWIQKESQKRKRSQNTGRKSSEPSPSPSIPFQPTEGGPDKLVCDVRYYARRVGLEVEVFKVQTEDGFIIELWHIYDPSERSPTPAQNRQESGPEVFPLRQTYPGNSRSDSKRKYPVLLMHGLLQSAGAFCTNDDDSLAFYLCKAGYDVWLGVNRCGFHPEHVLLHQKDPRMWAWNIRQMGVMDLPALISRVLAETQFPKLGLICHSQGTTQTFVALAKGQRPELGEKISVFCALAPAVYAGPLIGKAYFRFMRVISPAMFRLVFGIHSFIPLMMTMHRLLPSRWYGMMGYFVFSFLFDWSDKRWDRGLRDRLFLFSPVYVSSESMRWWLGRECFAKHKCVLSTKEEWRREEQEDAQTDVEDTEVANGDVDEKDTEMPTDKEESISSPIMKASRNTLRDKSSTAWYSGSCPPIALWVCGSDDLVDGRRLLRRFESGREPHVNIVHSKIIPEYEHLDVLWAVDSIERVGKEVKEVVWKTIPKEIREGIVRVQGIDDDSEENACPNSSCMDKEFSVS